MKGIFKGIITLLIILGIVKTFQDHDIINEANHYYDEVRNGQFVQTISSYDFNNLKNLHFDHFNPSDFF
ncbi:exported protein [Staphylococcus petrasii]|uniref:Exported protein n=1 Tax=Staphylococcus petrasii TaxID=1276936 RepID=A0A380FYC7_9STAP|nr:hypothetical protein [Staphylococcus petrasii]PNZ28930.1 hypothetical protein CD137_06725 [Staphylococcus petrasii]PNZ84203.1 hypothetical protein CD127_02300 [Staphylococcus petrasii]TGA81609.1 hypothetical protein E2554_08860 [Staphylococcus petrasii]TGE13650.1 hypothetical protein E2557_00735 [Staphylococcus petrasii]TGE18196.1 hypothetical protein BJR09_04505 [Staphylococcus petrasii]